MMILSGAKRVAWLLESYEKGYNRLVESFLSLVALGFVNTDRSRDEILSALTDQSWSTKHEVLTRWGWMSEHRRLLSGGHLDAPYSCRVAGRGRPGRNVDREFYQLLMFLHQLRAIEGEELLLFKKGETPDFILQDAKGRLVGAEMTEVSISEEWDQEHDTEAKVLDLLKLHSRGLNLYVRITRPSSWLPLTEQLPDFEEWFRAELDRNMPVEAAVTLESPFGLCVEVSPSSTGESWIILEDLGMAGSEIEIETLAMHETLRRRMGKKVYRIKSGMTFPRPRPSVRPCHLVIYPQHNIGQDIGDVVSQFLANAALDVSSHFDAVWLSGETGICRLV